MITPRQIEAFRAVMLTRSMTGAARILSVTQSAVSKIMHELEDELGFVLFSRRKGGLEPTPEAHALYMEVRKSFLGLDKIARAAQRIRAGRQGRLRIVSVPALTTGFLQKVVRVFLESGHRVEITLDTYNNEEVVDLVALGHADIGITMTPIDSYAVNVSPVMTAPCVCLLPHGHRLAAKERISLEDLRGEPFISLAENTTTRIRIDAAFRAANIARAGGLEARWSASVAAFVAQGLGVAIIEPFTARAHAHCGYVIRPLKQKIEFSFAEVTPKQSIQSTIARDFLDCFRQEVAAFQA
ncbi:LysR family transcriptional regulator [Kaustia mangrovi]|uniref:LysR family transcriptional regulator n=1 Tax=Kaustia mangrovi TaxID=2593653 RepID=A0A7S8C613_9HYPH|nr:LysR substrate-binding domain-containing protein [Kaustia mangrovi]QPC44050.1 LysR family transcriptional regulator [Kaustia mangrovi]